MRELPAVRDHGDPSDPVRRVEKRPDEAGHVEDLERPREDGERLGVLGLPDARLDDARRETAPRALVREKKADRPGADDQDVDIGRAGWHTADGQRFATAIVILNPSGSVREMSRTPQG